MSGESPTHNVITYFQLLGVEPELCQDEKALRRQFMRLMPLVHPDHGGKKVPDVFPDGEDPFALAQHAYRVLRSSRLCAQYLSLVQQASGSSTRGQLVHLLWRDGRSLVEDQDSQGGDGKQSNAPHTSTVDDQLSCAVQVDLDDLEELLDGDFVWQCARCQSTVDVPGFSLEDGVDHFACNGCSQVVQVLFEYIISEDEEDVVEEQQLEEDVVEEQQDGVGVVEEQQDGVGVECSVGVEGD